MVNSEMSRSKDPVQVASRKDLFSIIAYLDCKLPDCCEVYNHVLMYLRTSDPVYKVYFLPDSSGGYSAVVAIKKDGRLNEETQLIQRSWLITTWASDEETQLRVYNCIPSIDWRTDEFFFAGKNYEPASDIAACFTRHGRVLTTYPVHRYTMDRQTALNVQLHTPDHVYVKSLEPCHAHTVLDHCPYKDKIYVQTILDSIVQSPSAGVFVKDGDELVSWMISRTPAGMSLLHTMEEHRGRRYAAYVIRYLAKRMAQCGYVPYAIISVDNESSMRCFQHAGFDMDCAFHVAGAAFPKSD